MGIKTSKLKKRLRKKHHLAEFTEFGFEIFISLHERIDEAASDEFYSNFIVEIEKNKLLFGGGGDNQNLRGFITSGKRFSSPTNDDKEEISAWLKSR